jgi:hypothetical protein
VKLFIEYSPEHDVYCLGCVSNDDTGVCYIPLDLYRPDQPERHIPGRTYLDAIVPALEAANRRWDARKS